MATHPPTSGLLDQFRNHLEEPHPESASLDALLAALERAGQLETALGLLKRQHPRSGQQRNSPWGILRTRMEATVARNRETRMANWQLDPRRRLLRLAFSVEGEAAALNPSALGSSLASAFQQAGLPLAMGMEKHPRPMVTLATPLPLGVSGDREWADVTLSGPLGFPAAALGDHLQPHLTPGLAVLDAAEIPLVSSPVSDLCEEAHWRWQCPVELRDTARPRLEAFATSDRWEIEKQGKQAGQKVLKSTEVRSLVTRMAWEGDALRFSTRLRTENGTSPVKLLAGILACEPAAITGLARESVTLGEDPRLRNAYRFETKLSNLYEDAVLLDCGTGPTTRDDEDDELLIR